MSHFYGRMRGSRGEATRCGTKQSGMTVTAAGWGGAITVCLAQDKDGRDSYYVAATRWHGSGVDAHIASGIVGEAPQKAGVNGELLAALEDLLAAGNWEERQGAEADAEAIIAKIKGAA